jgi:hypothetical protein
LATEVKTGLAFLPFVGGFIGTVNVMQNVLLAKLGPKIAVPADMAITAGALGWLTHITVHTAYSSIVPEIILLGIGVGAVLVSCLSLGLAGAGPADAGVASALVSAAEQVGGSIGASLLNTIAVNASLRYLAANGGTHRTQIAASVHGDIVALTAGLVIMAAAGLVTGLLYPRND